MTTGIILELFYRNNELNSLLEYLDVTALSELSRYRCLHNAQLLMPMVQAQYVKNNVLICTLPLQLSKKTIQLHSSVLI